MSETSDAGFTPEDKIFFKRIRDDILARPDYYRPGMDYLQRRWSAAVLHENDLAERERLYEPDRRSARQLAIQFAGKSTGPEYEHAYRHFMQPQTFWLANSLTYAFGDLRQEGLGTSDDDLLTPYDLDKAKAVLCLTWLLTDPQADQHELGAGFGKWGDDFAEQIALKGRAMARLSVFDGHSAREWRGEWVRLAGKAWDVLHLQPKSTGTDGQTKSIEEGAATPPSASVDAKPADGPGAGKAVAATEPNIQAVALAGSHVAVAPALSPSDIAKAIGVPQKAEAIRKALGRLRDKNRLPDNACVEAQNVTKGQVRYLYYLPKVRPFLKRYEED